MTIFRMYSPCLNTQRRHAYVLGAARRLGQFVGVSIADIVAGPMRIAAVGPSADFFLLHFSVSFLQDTAELGQVALDLNQVFFRDLLPFVLERCFKLRPELSELFLIHRKLLRIKRGAETSRSETETLA